MLTEAEIYIVFHHCACMFEVTGLFACLLCCEGSTWGSTCSSVGRAPPGIVCHHNYVHVFKYFSGLYAHVRAYDVCSIC